MARRTLTHLNSRRQPAMVDVGAKEVTHRVAVAEARVRLPRSVARALRAAGLKPIRAWGGLDGGRFERLSQRLVMLARI